MPVQLEGVEHGSLLLVGRREDRSDPRQSVGRGRVEDVDLADPGERLHHPGDAHLDAAVGKLAAEQAQDHQGEDAVEGVHAQLLVGPVKGRAEREEARVLHLAERRLDVRLAPVGEHDLLIGPFLVIGEEQRLSEQRLTELHPGGFLEGEGEPG